MIGARLSPASIDGKTLLSLLDFEDAKEIIKNDDYLLQRFLGMYDEWGLGRRWSNSAGVQIRFYTLDGSDAFCDFHNLPYPSVSYDYYDIADGIHYWHHENEPRTQWTPLWEYTIVSLNQIEIHNFHNGRTYTLNRS